MYFISIQTLGTDSTIIVFYRLFRQNVAHNCDCCDDDSYFILKTIGEETLDEEEIWAFSSAKNKVIILIWDKKKIAFSKNLFPPPRIADEMAYKNVVLSYY